MDKATSQSGASPAWMFWRRRRHLVTFLTFLGFANIYILRVNINVGIVAMNSPYNVTLSNGTVVEKQDFNWDSKKQGVVLSSFFYGFLSTQVLGGWLGARWGGRSVFGVGVMMTALLTTLTPIAAQTSFYLLVVVRIVEGVFEGGIYPCAQALFAQWAPPQERSRMSAYIYVGLSVGTVLGLQMSGLIGSLMGWSPIFYITGIAGLIWSAAWFLVVKDCPEDDPHISAEELKYIKDSLGDDHNNLKEKTKITHPWGDILTSLPFWAFVIANFSVHWGHYTILTLLPMFMKDVFNYQLVKAGFLMSIPYILMAVTIQFAGGLSDWLVNKNILSTTMVRKVLTCVPLIIQAMCLALVGHLTSILGVLVCLMIDAGMESFTLTTGFVNCLELAPKHASVMFGISNTVATIAGSVSPLVSGFIIVDHTEEQWRSVFYIAAIILLLGTLMYGTFALGDKQPWAIKKGAHTSVNVEPEQNPYDNEAFVEEHM